MPSRNRIKVYVPGAYYHVYNRGVEKRLIFQDDRDYAVFLNLLKRYLDSESYFDPSNREYPKYSDGVDLLAYCMMPNHFHLLFYLKDEDSLKKLMQSVCTAYVKYFNKRYDRVGPLFQDRFKASHILREVYLQHISRYIHLNPKDWRTNRQTSLPYWLGNRSADWLHPEVVNSMTPKAYLDFLQDHEDYLESLALIESRLAT